MQLFFQKKICLHRNGFKKKSSVPLSGQKREDYWSDSLYKNGPTTGAREQKKKKMELKKKKKGVQDYWTGCVLSGIENMIRTFHFFCLVKIVE